MTEIEAQATTGYAGDTEGRPVWGQALVPLLAAVLVLAFGLAMVSLTSEAEPPFPEPPAAESGVF